MEDRELLELAAKAYGARIEIPDDEDGVFVVREKDRNGFVWNPLKDDGDAFRLAVKTGQALFTGLPHESATYACSSRSRCDFDGDPAAANRRVVVMAAAEIGKIMP